MALNISFQGDTYNALGVQLTDHEIRYQGFFVKVNPSSSASKFNTIRETFVGQYNINLGDGDWLTQDGNASAGDKVVLLFWMPNTSAQEQRTDTDLTAWGFIEYTLTSADTYVQDVQVRGPFIPNCIFSQTGSNRVNEDVYVNDIGSNDYHTWTFSGKTHYHQYQRYGEVMFTMNQLPADAININWGDFSSDLNLTPGSSYSHQYSVSDDYIITVTLTNRGNRSCNVQYTPRIYWHEPTVDFTADDFTPDPQGTNGKGALVTFTNLTNDPDGLSDDSGYPWSWDWELSDTGSYGNFTVNNNGVSFVFQPIHEWRNPGAHNITLTVNWWDGFNWQTADSVKVLTQGVWSVNNGLTWSTPVLADQEVIYSPNITGDYIYITGVNYSIDGNLLYSGLAYDESFKHTFTVSDDHEIEQCINYHDGFSSQIQCNDFTVQMEPVASFTSEKFECGLKFTSTSVPGTPPITSYTWEVKHVDSGVVLAITEGTSDVFVYSWPVLGRLRVTLTIVDSASVVSSVYEDYIVETCPTIERPARGGGSGSVIIQRPDISVKVTLIEKESVIQTNKIVVRKRKKRIIVYAYPINIRGEKC